MGFKISTSIEPTTKKAVLYRLKPFPRVRNLKPPTLNGNHLRYTNGKTNGLQSSTDCFFFLIFSTISLNKYDIYLRTHRTQPVLKYCCIHPEKLFKSRLV